MSDFTVKGKPETKVILSLLDIKKSEYIPWSENFSVDEYLQSDDGWEILKIDHYATSDSRDPLEDVYHWQAVTLMRTDWTNAKRIS